MPHGRRLVLCHSTSARAMRRILCSGKLLPARDVGRVNQGASMYRPSKQPFVFFFVATLDELDALLWGDECVLCFDPHVLTGRVFYSHHHHHPDPRETTRHAPPPSNWSAEERRDAVLSTLVRVRAKAVRSASRNRSTHPVLQQIAVKDAVSLKHLVAVRTSFCHTKR